MTAQKIPRVFVPNNPQVAIIAKKYKAPYELLLVLRGKDPKTLGIAYRCAVDREYFDLHAVKGEIELLGRVQYFKINTSGEEVYIHLRFPTCDIIWRLDKEKFQKKDVDQWYNELTDWLYVKAIRVEREDKRSKQRKALWIAKKVISVKIETDIETARLFIERLCNKFGDAGWFIGTALLFRYNVLRMRLTTSRRLIIARLLPIISPEPIHYVELTKPGTGKTSTAMICVTHLRWIYFTEVPTLATLVGDARTGRSRLPHSNGVWFDEFDAWGTKRSKLERLAELMETMLTGMEQGKWKRGAGGERVVEVEAHIPLVFTGNTKTAVDPREFVSKIVTRIAPDKAEAFNERISIALACVDPEVPADIQHNVVGAIPRTSVLRGLIELLHERYTQIENPDEEWIPKDLREGRWRRHFIRVYKALRTLGFDPDGAVEFAKLLVRGYCITEKDREEEQK